MVHEMSQREEGPSGLSLQVTTARTWKRSLSHQLFVDIMGVFHLQKISENLGISILEESVPFVTSPIHLQGPLRRFTKKPDVLLFSRTRLCLLLSHQTMLIIDMCGYEKSDICMFPSF